MVSNAVENKKKNFIIVAKPGVYVAPAAVGKTTLAMKYPEKIRDEGPANFKTIDSDSLKPRTEYEKKFSEENKDFPENYFKAIKMQSNNYDIVLTAFLIELHKDPDFAKKLKDEHLIDFTIAIPELSSLKILVKRMIDRGNNPDFIKFIINTYPAIIKEFTKSKYNSLIISKQDDYILENAFIREKIIVPQKSFTNCDELNKIV